MLEGSRRGFITGLISLVAAPAIVRPLSLMPVRGEVLTLASGAARNNLLTINMITREAVKLFVNSNAFLQNLNDQWPEWSDGHTLKIRMPNSEWRYIK